MKCTSILDIARAVAALPPDAFRRYVDLHPLDYNRVNDYVLTTPCYICGKAIENAVVRYLGRAVHPRCWYSVRPDNPDREPDPNFQYPAPIFKFLRDIGTVTPRELITRPIIGETTGKDVISDRTARIWELEIQVEEIETAIDRARRSGDYFRDMGYEGLARKYYEEWERLSPDLATARDRLSRATAEGDPDDVEK